MHGSQLPLWSCSRVCSLRAAWHSGSSCVWASSAGSSTPGCPSAVWHGRCSCSPVQGRQLGGACVPLHPTLEPAAPASHPARLCSLPRSAQTKAKAIRKYVDKMIGLAKEGTLHARRQALGFIYDAELVKSLFEQVCAPGCGRRHPARSHCRLAGGCVAAAGMCAGWRAEVQPACNSPSCCPRLPHFSLPVLRKCCDDCEGSYPPHAPSAATHTPLPAASFHPRRCPPATATATAATAA